MVQVLTEDQYLASKGVSFSASGYCLDKLRSNRTIRSVRGKKRFEKECAEAERAYQEKRAKAKAEYKSMLEQGKVRTETSLERRLRIANGHPDNASTQAARRLLAKMGIDWKTGLKLEEIKREH